MSAISDKRCVLILGPHRSGTSVISRALAGAGFSLGDHLLEPNEDNPKGFYENAGIVAFNDRLLKHIGLCWDYIGPVRDDVFEAEDLAHWADTALALLREEFGDAPRIAIKDPRLCLLAPFWNRVLSGAGFAISHVLVLRHPAECAQSQRVRLQRDPSYHFVGGDLVEGLLLWGVYLHEALRYLAAGQTFALVSYHRLLENPEAALAQLDQALQLSLPQDASGEFVHRFVDKSLHRNQRDRLAPETTDVIKPYVAIFDELGALDAAQLHDAAYCARLLGQMPTLLDSVVRTRALAQVFVRARHTAVEANLALAEARRIVAYQEHALKDANRELAEARNIVAFQEHALEQSRLRTAELEQRAIAAQNRLIAERKINERHELLRAAQQDRADAGGEVRRDEH